MATLLSLGAIVVGVVVVYVGLHGSQSGVLDLLKGKK